MASTEPSADNTSPVNMSTHACDRDTGSVFQNVSRLPKLNLPTFTGDSFQWKSFWDSFIAAVHFNEGLSGVQKFNYLCAQLRSYAFHVIAGFLLTNDNYAHSYYAAQ